MRDGGDAQRRADRIKAFAMELDQLLHEGVVALTPQQRAAIAQHHDAVLQRLATGYDVNVTDRAARLSRGMQVAAFVAAVALTAAVLSLGSHYWGRFDLPLQATLLCALPLTLLIAVEFSARRERSLYIASICALAALGSYWLAVGMLSDMLSVPFPPAALWGGALFGLSLSLPYGFRFILGLSLVALLVALAGSAFQAVGTPWTVALEYPEIVGTSAFALAALAPGFGALHPAFAGVTRLVGCGVGFLALLVLSSIGTTSLLPLSRTGAEFLYQGLTLMALVVTLTLAVRRRWPETLYLASTAATVFLLLRLIDWMWAAVPRYVFFLVLAGGAFGWFAVLRRMRARLVKGRR
jgi:hypothetical protein